MRDDRWSLLVFFGYFVIGGQQSPLSILRSAMYISSLCIYSCLLADLYDLCFMLTFVVVFFLHTKLTYFLYLLIDWVQFSVPFGLYLLCMWCMCLCIPTCVSSVWVYSTINAIFVQTEEMGGGAVLSDILHDWLSALVCRQVLYLCICYWISMCLSQCSSENAVFFCKQCSSAMVKQCFFCYG